MDYKKLTDPEGVSLLASILICYNEISTVSYEPKNRSVKITFTMNKAMDEKIFHELVEFLDESIHTYHMISGIDFAPIEFSMETQGAYSFLHIVRDLETLSKGELSLITTILSERAGDNLIAGGEAQIDEDMMEMQEENLERMLMTTRLMQMRNRLVGVREGDAVMVYDK